jgi:hypothetical protein
MIDHVILHVEGANDVPESEGGWAAAGKVGVACAVLYEYRTGRFRVFGPGDVNQLRQRVHGADWVSGYNLLRFDYPALWGTDFENFRVGNQFRPLAARTNDIVRRISMASGRHHDVAADIPGVWTLTALGEGTLGRTRAGTGREAPGHHDAGNWPAVVSYGLDACGLVRELIEFVERYGYVVHGGSGFFLDVRRTAARGPLGDQRIAPWEGQ